MQLKHLSTAEVPWLGNFHKVFLKPPGNAHISDVFVLWSQDERTPPPWSSSMKTVVFRLGPYSSEVAEPVGAVQLHLPTF